MATEAEFVVCTESFVGELEPPKGDRPAREIRGVAGTTIVRSDSDIAKRFAAFFRPLDKPHYGGSEDATRDPGTRRGGARV